MRTIDLNADVGEGFGADAELIPLVTSANIACGGHAGDESTMQCAVEAAVAAGVAIGAHPGHEDREHFGRREIDLTPEAAGRLVASQVERLMAVAGPLGGTVRYVKLHGALYHQTGRDDSLAAAIVEAVRRFSPPLSLLGQVGTCLEASAVAAGVAYYGEAFADRAYQTDGSLAPRAVDGAVLDSEKAVVEQAVRLAVEGRARTLTGGAIAVRCDSLCLHGDGEGVVARARAVRRAIESEGAVIRAFTA